MRDRDLEAFAHADVPFERLVDAVVPARTTAHHPLFQVAFEVQRGDAAVPELPELAVERLDLDPGISKFDLQLSVTERYAADGSPAGLSAACLYATDVFDEATARGFAERFRRMLAAVCADPGVVVGDVDILDAAERRALVPARGPAAGPVRSLTEILADAVRRAGDMAAVVCAGRELSYRELDAWSDRLARVLIGRGARSERFVAVALARSVEFVVAVWAVAKTGAAFLPVDPAYPTNRIDHMLANSGARLGITVAAHRPGLPDAADWIVLDEPHTASAVTEASPGSVTDAERRGGLWLDSPAYLIYTSGSTGVPKGVVVTHRGLADLAAAWVSRCRMERGSRALHVASPSFDAAVLELLVAFEATATLVITSAGVRGGPELAALLEHERVTHGLLTPSALGTVDPAGLDGFGQVVVGGEACPAELVARWAPGRVMRNAYGPAEATVATNMSEALVARGPVTLGSPVRGVREVVLDARLQSGAGGGGGGVVCGGAGGGARVSGAGGVDGGAVRGRSVRWQVFGCIGRGMWCGGAPMGELVFVGRSDVQVKLRGFRIEPGEVEAALVAHPGVAQAVVVVRDDGVGDRLVGYVVARSGAVLDGAGLRRFVGERLPEFMVPAAVVVLDRLPLTVNAKVDRAGLPAPDYAAAVRYRAPQTPVQEVLAGLFAEVLGVARVGVDDDFFALGGDSLAATRLVARVNAALGVLVEVRAVFDAPTVAELAQSVPQSGAGTRPVLEPRERPTWIPLSFAQRRMWFLNRFDPKSGAYNIPVAVRLSGELDTAALATALRDVVQRHESLRTVFPDSAQGPHQVPADIAGVEIDTTPAPVDRAELATRLDAVASAGFDVTEQIPLRAETVSSGRGGARAAVGDTPHCRRRCVDGPVGPRPRDGVRGAPRRAPAAVGTAARAIRGLHSLAKRMARVGAGRRSTVPHAN